MISAKKSLSKSRSFMILILLFQIISFVFIFHQFIMTVNESKSEVSKM